MMLYRDPIKMLGAILTEMCLQGEVELIHILDKKIGYVSKVLLYVFMGILRGKITVEIGLVISIL